MVIEREILLTIKNFKQGRSRVTSEIISKLVYLIKENKRIVSFSLSHSVHNSTLHSTKICSSVSTNFAFIVYTAKCNSCIAFSQCLSNRFCD